VTLIKSISGIRGTIGGKPDDGLTPLDIVKYTSAYGAWILSNGKAKQKTTIIIGRDARMSGSMVTNLVSGTLIGLGINVIDLELSTTPTVEMAVTEFKAQGGIILTASHNPKQWNALKLLNEKGEFISDKNGQDILKLAEDANFNYAEVNDLGTYVVNNDFLNTHIKKIIDLPYVDIKAIENLCILKGYEYKEPKKIVDIARWNKKFKKYCGSAKLEQTFLCVKDNLDSEISEILDHLPKGNAHNPLMDSTMTLIIALFTLKSFKL
jgi:phosphomannomutase